MNFFENQKRARRNTSILMLLYLACVIAIIIGVYVIVIAVWAGSMPQVGGNAFRNLPRGSFWQPELFTLIAGGTLVLVVFGSLFKLMQLARGGEAVAQRLGGRMIPPNSRDPRERKILNIVEEVAIASGVPVPPVYLLENEASINAFAAGFSPKRAVIGVTAGCLNNLNRDQLQGVIAHEFSHILNGDMRLNLRLVALLNGILLISMAGYVLWRSSYNPYSRYNSRGNRSDNKESYLVLIGILVYVLGYIGVFFANLIKSAVSRQREYLADASAVEFTRNPKGIGGALRKIAEFAAGSRVEHPSAQEVSHFFFANGLRHAFLGLFATHPPLAERIKRIDSTLALGLQPPQPSSAAPAGRQADDVSMVQDQLLGTAIPPAPQVPRAEVMSTVGSLTAAHISYSQALLESLSAEILELAHDPTSARAVIYCLLLGAEDGIRTKQLEYLHQAGDALAERDLNKALRLTAGLGPQYRLPLANACLSALRCLPPNEYESFRVHTQFLIEIDRTCSVFEYALQRMLKRSLDPLFSPAGRRTRKAAASADKTKNALNQLVIALAYLSNSDEDSARSAAMRGLAALGVSPPELVDRRQISLGTLDLALVNLESAPFAVKEQALKACIESVFCDRVVTAHEAELVRAVADALECPVPPFSVGD